MLGGGSTAKVPTVSGVKEFKRQNLSCWLKKAKKEKVIDIVNLPTVHRLSAFLNFVVAKEQSKSKMTKIHVNGFSAMHTGASKMSYFLSNHPIEIRSSC